MRSSLRSEGNVAGTDLGTDGREAVVAHALAPLGLSFSQSLPQAPPTLDCRPPLSNYDHISPMKRPASSPQTHMSKVQCSRGKDGMQDSPLNLENFEFTEGNKRENSSRHKISIRCDVCGNRFRNEKLLLMHMRLVHRGKGCMVSLVDRTATAAGTSQTASDKEQLEPCTSTPLFLKLPHGDEKSPMACKFCQVLFWNQEVFLDHQTLCGNKHLPKEELEKLALTNVCQICQLVFADAGLLAYHKRSGCGEQTAPVSNPTVCPLCGQQFLDPGYLSAHIWSCGKTGNAQTSVAQALPADDTMVSAVTGSVGAASANSSTNSCEECGKAFQSRTSLVDHINSMHRGMQFTCPDCGETFKWRTCVYRHKTRCKKANN